MPRRANSSVKPATLILVAVGLAVVAAVAWGMLNKGSDPFDGVTDLTIDDYMDNAPSFQGNVYKLQGTVVEQLKWTPNNGRLFNVLLDGLSFVDGTIFGKHWIDRKRSG